MNGEPELQVPPAALDGTRTLAEDLGGRIADDMHIRGRWVLELYFRDGTLEDARFRGKLPPGALGRFDVKSDAA